MYDVYFSYFDGNDHLCTNVDKIEIPTSSGIRTYSGDEHSFPTRRSSDLASSMQISCQ